MQCALPLIYPTPLVSSKDDDGDDGILIIKIFVYLPALCGLSIDVSLGTITTIDDEFSSTVRQTHSNNKNVHKKHQTETGATDLASRPLHGAAIW